MKKIYSIIITIFMMSLVGCVTDPATYYFNADELTDNVIKIELVNFVNENPKIVTINEDTALSFNIVNASLINELDNSKIINFVSELSTITFHVENESVDSPLGNTLIIYMKNQEIIVLSCTVVNGMAYSMVALFTIEGVFIKHIAKFADEPKFTKLLEKYFDI